MTHLLKSDAPFKSYFKSKVLGRFSKLKFFLFACDSISRYGILSPELQIIALSCSG